MGTPAPILTDAFHLLHTNLYAHLDAAEILAGIDTWSPHEVDTAHELIPDLVVVIRGLLIEHEAGLDDDCRTCRSKWPCPVVTTIHALVKDPDGKFVAILSAINDE